MSKSFFRYLRGEINGYYLNAIHGTVEKEVSDIKAFLTEFYNMQFELGKISTEMLFNIGKFASIFLPRRPLNESLTSIYMTDSKIVDGNEYSERGLYNTEKEKFVFYHTDTTSTDDINTLSTDIERSTLVGDEEPLGYISEYDDEVLDDEGKVRFEKVSETPPESGAYSNWYGNNFLYLSEGDINYFPISTSLYIELYKAMQYIRYNGVSVKSLCNVISVLCPEGLVKIEHIDISSSGNYIYVYYNYDNSVDVSFKEHRLSLLEYIINLKFKQIMLIENNPQE